MSKLPSDNRNLRNTSQTVDSALRLLQAVAGAGAPVGVSKAASLIGVSPTAAHRLMRSLTTAGLVIQNKDRTYALGPGVLELAQQYLDGIDVRQFCRPLLAEIRDLSGETTSLIIRQGDMRICIDYAWSPHEIAYRPQLGEALPITTGATGRAFLSTLPRDEQLRLLRELSTADYHAPADVDQALELIEAGRKRGYFISMAERIAGMNGIAIPVIGDDESLLATISVVGPADRWTEQRIAEIGPEILQKVSKYSHLKYHLNRP